MSEEFTNAHGQTDIWKLKESIVTNNEQTWPLLGFIVKIINLLLLLAPFRAKSFYQNESEWPEMDFNH